MYIQIIKAINSLGSTSKYTITRHKDKYTAKLKDEIELLSIFLLVSTIVLFAMLLSLYDQPAPTFYNLTSKRHLQNNTNDSLPTKKTSISNTPTLIDLIFKLLIKYLDFSS